VDVALYRLRSPGVAHPFSAEQLAALRAVKPVDVPSAATGGLVTTLREATRAWPREGNPRRREALEQEMFLTLQRYAADMDAAADARDERVRAALGAEGYRALLEIGNWPPFPIKPGPATTAPAGAATRPAR